MVFATLNGYVCHSATPIAIARRPWKHFFRMREHIRIVPILKGIEIIFDPDDFISFKHVDVFLQVGVIGLITL